MARWEFFKAWEEKAKQILHYYFSRIMEVEEECFGERSYIYYIKTDIRPLSSNPIIISDNKDINKPSPLSFYIDIIIEDKSTKDTGDKGDLKDL